MFTPKLNNLIIKGKYDIEYLALSLTRYTEMLSSIAPIKNFSKDNSNA